MKYEMKEYKFGFDVANLATYTSYVENVHANAIYGSDLVKSGIEVIPGQKLGTVSLTTLSNDLYLQTTSDGWTVSGQTNFNPINITMCSLDYKENLSIRDLETKWMSTLLKKGYDPSDPIPFIEMIGSTKEQQLSSEIDYIGWQGNTATGTINLALCNGIIKYLSGKTYTYVAEATGTTTKANVMTKVKALVENMDERLIGKVGVNLYMSPANYLLWGLAKAEANLYNPEDVFPIPVNILPQSGLRGSDLYYLMPANNIVLATDLLTDIENMKIIDNPFGSLIGYKQIFGTVKLGFGVWEPNLVVTNQPR